MKKHKLAAQILAAVNALLSGKGLLLRVGTVVDATLIAAPSSTKSGSGERDLKMHQSRKGNQWYFEMKAHIGVDAKSGVVQTVRGTSGNVGGVVQTNSLHATQRVRWTIAMRPGKRAALRNAQTPGQLTDQRERLKASIRAKVEHPLQLIKRQFGRVKVRCRGLNKSLPLASCGEHFYPCPLSVQRPRAS